MKPDSAGFLYPSLDPDKCIGCHLCEKVCDFVPRPELKEDCYPKFYGARQKNVCEVMKSRSGAIFAALARLIFNLGGVVYGAALTKDFSVSHVRITSESGLDSLRGSKYVQSDLRGVFRNAKSDLEAGLPVLFSGTPCQTSTLRKYIPLKLHEKLFVLDIVCHGVPGPAYWTEFLRFIERKYGKRISHVNFRDKERFNWKRHQETFLFEGDPEPKVVKYRFYNELMFRRSCGNCYFAALNRPSDITLADFWGYEKTGTLINDDLKGLNLVMVNSDKGNYLFEKIKPLLDWFETTREYAMQPNLEHCTPRHADADRFRRDFEKHGFRFVMVKYGNAGLWFQICRIFKAVKKRMKRLI